ncbi:MAG: oxidoreductase [Parcubacteria group bacterium]|nr:oxidoreductase [Parcubacteria group bacterium]
MIDIATIPTLSMKDYHGLDGGDRALFVRQLGHALAGPGFFFLKDHGLNRIAVQCSLSQLPIFFDSGMSEEERMQYCASDISGYTPEDSETALDALLPDKKRTFHIRRGHAPYVYEIPSFTHWLYVMLEEFEKLSIPLLKATALSLGLEKEALSSQMGNGLLRAAHYGANDPNDKNPPPGAGAHTDINVLTILLAPQAGLELWYEDTWVPITINDPNTLIINCGDMLEHFTNGHYKSGLHRVVPTPGVARWSLPYFAHLKPEADITPLVGFGVVDTKRFPHGTAGAFLDDRVTKIGLGKK